jgi:hypothetical protein
MLRIGLGKHHEFRVCRIAACSGVVIEEIIDLVSGERQAESDIGLGQRGTTRSGHVDSHQRCRPVMLEQ